MPDRLLTYLADAENPIPQAMHSYFERQGFVLEAYQNNEDFKEALLIFAPLWDGQRYQSPEGVWAKYMSKKYPNAKLIVLSNLPAKDPNYVDLFNLPSDWPAFLSQTPSAKRFETERPVFTGGMDMEERLLRFLKGHGNESLMDICKELLHNLSRSIDVVAKDNNGFNIKEIIYLLNSKMYHTQFKITENRWCNYKPLFRYMPFQTNIEEIDKLIDTMRQAFNDQEIDEVNLDAWLKIVVASLEDLQSRLKELEQYVRINP